MSTKYQGHPSHAHWNVALWIANDEGLYRRAKHYLRETSRAKAAEAMLGELHECGVTATPDGVEYTARLISYAMTGL